MIAIREIKFIFLLRFSLQRKMFLPLWYVLPYKASKLMLMIDAIIIHIIIREAIYKTSNLIYSWFQICLSNWSKGFRLPISPFTLLYNFLRLFSKVKNATLWEHLIADRGQLYSKHEQFICPSNSDRGANIYMHSPCNLVMIWISIQIHSASFC